MKINSVKFKDKKSFDKNKGKANVVAVHEPFGIIVFKDDSPVAADTTKVSHVNSVDASLDSIASGLAILLAKDYNESKHYLEANNIVVADKFESTKTFFVYVPDFIPFDSFYGSIMATGLFISVEPDYIVPMQASAEMLYEGHWHLPNLKASEAWALLPQGVVKEVAVLDVACETTHEDLLGMISATSWNCVTDGPDVNPTSEFEKHGTCCSGVIAANSGNGVGCMSIGNNHLRVQFLHIGYNSSSTGGFFTSDTICTRAINKAIANPDCVAVSMSWGGTASYPIFSNALNSARTTARGGKGIPLFASSGNNSAPSFSQNPAAYTSVMAVGASAQNNTRAPFSNFGPTLFACAPGVSLWTVDRTGASGYGPDSYKGFSGTSAASPAMAAVAGTILVKNPNLTEAQVREIIKNSCRKTGGYVYYDTGRSLELGYGVVDMYTAVTLAGGTDAGQPTPSINIYGVISTPASVEQGASVPITYSVVADKVVDKDTQVEFTLSWRNADGITSTFYNGNTMIPAGQSSQSGTIPYTVSNMASGVCQFVMTIDPNNYILESNETDNTAVTSINVVQPLPPTLKLDIAVELTGYKWLDANRCSISYKATNKGSETITSWKASVGFAGRQPMTWNRADVLSPGRFTSGGTVWYVTSMGTLPNTFKLEATAVNGMPDENSANNVATILISK